MASFTQRRTTPKKGSAARGSIVRKFETSDEDDSSDQSDSDDEQSWKRRKSNLAPPPSHRMPQQNPPRGYDRRGPGFNRGGSRPQRDVKAPSGTGSRHRKNNIWGSVAVEQNQEAVEREITNIGVEAVSERDVESYSFKDTQQLPLGILTSQPTEGSIPKGRRLMKGVGEGEDDAWLADESPPEESDEEERALEMPKDDLRERLKQRGSLVADKFRRSNVKNRLGSRSADIHQAVEMKSIEIDPTAEGKVIAGQLAYSLQEPKRQLILRVVKILGVEKSLEIWKKTEEIENDGGMMIMNRSRRRSPGGVFIQLMKTDPQVSPEMVKEIFAEEKKIFDADRRKKRKRSRKFAGAGANIDHRGNSDEEEEEAMEGDVGNDDEREGEDGGMKDTPVMSEKVDPHATAQGKLMQDDDMKAMIDEQQTVEQVGDDLPLPQKECADIKETDTMMFPKLDDIPQRNEDSEPEDGEVLDDDDDS